MFAIVAFLYISSLSFFLSALQHAGKHMEDSIVASYSALLLGCLCQGSPVSKALIIAFLKNKVYFHIFSFFSFHVNFSQMNVNTVRDSLPKGDFSIMTEMLKKFLNFMNLTVKAADDIE